MANKIKSVQTDFEAEILEFYGPVSAELMERLYKNFLKDPKIFDAVEWIWKTPFSEATK